MNEDAQLEILDVKPMDLILSISVPETTMKDCCSSVRKESSIEIKRSRV